MVWAWRGWLTAWVALQSVGGGLDALAAKRALLTWSPSPSYGVTNYAVYFGTSSQAGKTRPEAAYEFTNRVGNVTRCVVSNLVEGATYYFALTAMNEFGESSFSQEVRLSVPLVPGTNLPPSATSSTLSTTVNFPVNIVLLANDPENDALRYLIVEQPEHGVVAPDTGSKAVVYRPSLDFVGTDRFTFGASDGTSASLATVTVTVNASAELRPIPATYTSFEDTPLALELEAGGPSPLVRTFEIVQPPANGALTAGGGNVYRYVPKADYHGIDGFTFRVRSATGDSWSPPASVAIEVMPVNDPPRLGGLGDITQTGTRASWIPLEVSDVETSALSKFTFSAASSDPLVVALGERPVEMRGRVPYLHLTPTPFATGECFVWVTVTDPEGASSATGFTVRIEEDPAARSDFDGDGNNDLLLQHTEGFLALWAMNRTNFLRAVLPVPFVPDAAEWRLRASGDLNGDRKPDLVFQDDLGAVRVWIMNGATRVDSRPILSAPPADPAWRLVAAPRLLGPKSPSLLFQHEDGSLGVWQLDGLSWVSTHALEPATPGDGWRAVGAADYDADGTDDLVFQHQTGAVAVWLMNGFRWKQPHLLFPMLSSAADEVRAVTDLDGNGSPDLLFRRGDGGMEIWLMDRFNWIGSYVLIEPETAMGISPSVRQYIRPESGLDPAVGWDIVGPR